MPNQPDVNKDLITVQCTVETRVRLEKLAQARGVSRSACAASVLREGVAGVILTPEEYREIADLIENRKQKKGKK